MMQELRDKVTDTKGKISKFSDKRGEGGKNVPLPPPPPPPITPAQRQPLAMSHIKQSGVMEEDKSSSRTSSSSGRKNRDLSPRRGTASPVNHQRKPGSRTGSSPDRRQGASDSPMARSRGSRGSGNRGSPVQRQGARSPFGRGSGTRSPVGRAGQNIRSPSERRIQGNNSSPSGRRRNRDMRRHDSMAGPTREEDHKRSRSLGPLQARQESPSRHQTRGSRDRHQEVDVEDTRGRSRSRGRRTNDSSNEQQVAASRRPGDGSSFHRSKSNGRYSPSRPSELDRSGQGGREPGMIPPGGNIHGGERYRGDGEWRDRRGLALSPSRRDGFSPMRREGFSPVREMRVGGGVHAPPSPEEAQAVLEKMLPR